MRSPSSNPHARESLEGFKQTKNLIGSCLKGSPADGHCREGGWGGQAGGPRKGPRASRWDVGRVTRVAVVVRAMLTVQILSDEGPTELACGMVVGGKDREQRVLLLGMEGLPGPQGPPFYCVWHLRTSSNSPNSPARQKYTPPSLPELPFMVVRT